MIRLQTGLATDVRVGAEEPPEGDALAGLRHKKMFARAQDERAPDGNVDGANVADIVGHGAETAVHLLHKRPLPVFVHIFKLVHLDEKIVEAIQTKAGRAAGVVKRVLLQLADQIGESQPGGM